MPRPIPRAFSDEFLRSNGILDLDPETLLQLRSCGVLPIEERKSLRWLTLMDYLSAVRVTLQAEPRAGLADSRQNAATIYDADPPSKN